MLKHPPNKGKHFSFDSLRREISKYTQSVQQCTGWGETLVAVLRKITSRYVYA